MISTFLFERRPGRGRRQPPEGRGRVQSVRRPARKVERDFMAEADRLFAARGVTQWDFARLRHYRNPVSRWYIPELPLEGRVEVINDDRIEAIRVALAKI